MFPAFRISVLAYQPPNYPTPITVAENDLHPKPEATGYQSEHCIRHTLGGGVKG